MITLKGVDAVQVTNTNVTSLIVPLVNALPAAGDVLVVFTGTNHTTMGSRYFVWGQSGQAFTQARFRNAPGNALAGGLYYRISDGTETQVEVDFDGHAGRGSAVVFCVTADETLTYVASSFNPANENTPVTDQPTGPLELLAGDFAIYGNATSTARRWLESKTSLDRGTVAWAIQTATSVGAGIAGYELIPADGTVEATFSTNDAIVDSACIGFIGACREEVSGPGKSYRMDLEPGEMEASGTPMHLYHYAAAPRIQLPGAKLECSGTSMSMTLRTPVGGTFTFPLDEGQGTVVRCVENPNANGSVNDPGAWAFFPSNNRWYPIDEGAGDTLNDKIGGHTATIQNHNEDSWG